MDTVRLTSIGIDIGSTTSHLLLSELVLQRQGQDLSSRFEVVNRRVLYQSPIVLTPYKEENLALDSEALDEFIGAALNEAGVQMDEIDTGAVILTGVALERHNARAVAELFAHQTGRFVCATAGHTYEALLAAHGSGVVELSLEIGGPAMNVDIGGGTTKFAIADKGEVVATMAIAVGARLVVMDADHRIVRTDSPIERLAKQSGLTLRAGDTLEAGDRRRLARTIAEQILNVVRECTGSNEPRSGKSDYWLAGQLPLVGPVPIVYSGGVSEYLHRKHSSRDVGDLGILIADEIGSSEEGFQGSTNRRSSGIRATVLGASQFTAQLSGNTIHISDDEILPMRNLAVAPITITDAKVDLDRVVEQIDFSIIERGLEESSTPIAIFLSWQGVPSYQNLRRLAEALYRAHMSSARRNVALVAVMDSDVARSIGRIISDELQHDLPVAVIDGLNLTPLDFVDLGQRLTPSNTVPVVIKTLVVANNAPRT